MPPIPRDRLPDSTLPFVRDPYRFISRRCAAHGSDLFEARILAERTICMRGAEAARLFYDARSFERAGAAPRRVRKTLFGEGSVQGLDGEAHRHRKALLMSLMTPAHVERLVRGFQRRLERSARAWTSRERIVLLDELHEILTGAATEWVGLRVPQKDVPRLTRDLVAMLEAPAALGPRYRRARRARRRAERRLSTAVQRVRADGASGSVEGSSPLRAVALHADVDGAPLEARVAAAELLNLLRPTVAVARFIAFGALALHLHPWTRELLYASDAESTEWFVHEVRRFYPFSPVVAARVRSDVAWSGYHLPAGRRALLDLHGTNRDPRSWYRPDEFLPERFESWDGDPFRLIPQGGGDPFAGHRCAGEGLTIELMKHALGYLANELRYDVPPQRLWVDMRRAPAKLESGFVMANVRPARSWQPAATARETPAVLQS